eukprot:2303025-Amphidinium_carterae.1
MATLKRPKGSKRTNWWTKVWHHEKASFLGEEHHEHEGQKVDLTSEQGRKRTHTFVEILPTETRRCGNLTPAAPWKEVFEVSRTTKAHSRDYIFTEGASASCLPMAPST